MQEKTAIQEKIKIIKYDPITVDNSKESDKMDIVQPGKISWTAHMRIEKYNNRESFDAGIPDEVHNVEGNTATNKGLFTLWQLVMGFDPNTSGINWPGDGTNPAESNYTGVYPLNATNTYLGVGDSSNAAAATNMVLQGTNQAWVQCDTGYPQVVYTNNQNTLQVKATFDSDTANFTWSEWGVANGDHPGAGSFSSPRDEHNVVLFNRRVDTMGTKAVGAVWVIIADLVISPTAS